MRPRRRGTPRSPSATRSGWSTSCARRSGADELHALLAADNENPRVTLVARPGRSTRDELPGEPTPYSPYGVVLEGGDPRSVPAVAEGRAGVQDEGSQLVALALAGAPLEGRDELWLDLCAGPGRQGRAAGGAGRRARRAAGRQRAAAARAPGWSAARSRPTTRARWRPASPAWSPRTAPWRRTAPASSTGSWSTRPAPGWARCGAAPRPAGGASPTTCSRWSCCSGSWSGSALDLVRPGGVVLYATCSPVISETANVVTSVNGARIDAELADLGPQFADVPRSEGPVPGTVQLWPHRHGTDAMFMALFRRSLPVASRAWPRPSRPRWRSRSTTGWCGSATPTGSTSRRAGRPSSTWSSTTSPSAPASSTRCASGPACCTGSRRGWPTRRCTRSGCRPARPTGSRRCSCTSRAGAAPPTSCA